MVLGKSPASEIPCPFFICVLFRTMFLSALLIVALPANLPVGMILTVASYVMFMFQVMRYQDQMPVEYLRSTGFISILGFGVLATSEEAGFRMDERLCHARPARMGEKGNLTAAATPQS